MLALFNSYFLSICSWLFAISNVIRDCEQVICTLSRRFSLGGAHLFPSCSGCCLLKVRTHVSKLCLWIREVSLAQRCLETHTALKGGPWPIVTDTVYKRPAFSFQMGRSLWHILLWSSHGIKTEARPLLELHLLPRLLRLGLSLSCFSHSSAFS